VIISSEDSSDSSTTFLAGLEATFYFLATFTIGVSSEEDSSTTTFFFDFLTTTTGESSDEVSS